MKFESSLLKRLSFFSLSNFRCNHCRFYSEAVKWHWTCSYWDGYLWQHSPKLGERLQRKKWTIHCSCSWDLSIRRVLDKLWKRVVFRLGEKRPRCIVQVVHKEWSHVLYVICRRRTVRHGRYRPCPVPVFSNEPKTRKILRFQWIPD